MCNFETNLININELLTCGYMYVHVPVITNLLKKKKPYLDEVNIKCIYGIKDIYA